MRTEQKQTTVRKRNQQLGDDHITMIMMILMIIVMMIMMMMMIDDIDDDDDVDDPNHSIRKILSLTMLRDRTQRAWSIFTVPVPSQLNIQLSTNSIKSDLINYSPIVFLHVNHRDGKIG